MIRALGSTCLCEVPGSIPGQAPFFLFCSFLHTLFFFAPWKKMDCLFYFQS